MMSTIALHCLSVKHVFRTIDWKGRKNGYALDHKNKELFQDKFGNFCLFYDIPLLLFKLLDDIMFNLMVQTIK